jgi:hypothetical protein
MRSSEKASLERLYQKIESIVAEHNSKLPEKVVLLPLARDEEQRKLHENFRIMHADIKGRKKAQRLAMKIESS